MKFIKIGICEEYPQLVGLIIGVMGIEKSKRKPEKVKEPSLRELILSNRDMILSNRDMIIKMDEKFEFRFNRLDQRFDNLIKKNNLKE